MYPATDQISPSMSPRPNASFVSMSSQSNAADRKSTRLNSSHLVISYAVFCLKKKKIVFHFKDGSDHYEITSFSQRDHFRLIISEPVPHSPEVPPHSAVSLA